MVAVQAAHGSVRTSGCAQLYRCAQTQWTCKLAVQLTLYVLFLAISMGAGGTMPWILQRYLGRPLHGNVPQQQVYREESGYSYANSNTYSYCINSAAVVGSIPRGYPAPPLSPKGSRLFDAWFHAPVILRGISWSGFNTQPPGLEGLVNGQEAMAAADLHAITYQLTLLGFNTIKLPFSFQALKAAAAKQERPCKHSNVSDWALRASEPHTRPLPDTQQLPAPPVYLPQHSGSCNSYLPDTDGLGRLLWTVQYFVANGFYVTLTYQPLPGEAAHEDRKAFALAWLSLWTRITCLENFSADIRGRLLLDLLNQPSRHSGGMGWGADGGKPGLTRLYLSVMDAIEGMTPRDALFMLQGSAVSHFWATDAGGGLNAYGLSPGDGFVLDEAAITAYQLSDPKSFFEALLQRPYSNRVLLAPHLLGPASSGAVLDTASDLVQKMQGSWGRLASEGFCSGLVCARFPVVAGEVGSRLDVEGEVEYNEAVADYAGLHKSPAGSGQQPLQGWIWSGYSNATGPGPLLEGDWSHFDWPPLRFLIIRLGLRPWFKYPKEWLQQAAAQRNKDAATAAAEAAATAAAAAAASKASQADNEVVSGNFSGTLEQLYQHAAADAGLHNSTVLPALASAAGATANATSTATQPGGLTPGGSSSSSSTATMQSAPSPVLTSPALPPTLTQQQPTASPVLASPPRAPSLTPQPPAAISSPAPTPVPAPVLPPAPAAVSSPTPGPSSSKESASKGTEPAGAKAGADASSSQAPASQQHGPAAKPPAAHTTPPVGSTLAAPVPASEPPKAAAAPTAPQIPPAQTTAQPGPGPAGTPQPAQGVASQSVTQHPPAAPPPALKPAPVPSPQQPDSAQGNGPLHGGALAPPTDSSKATSAPTGGAPAGQAVEAGKQAAVAVPSPASQPQPPVQPQVQPAVAPPPQSQQPASAQQPQPQQQPGHPAPVPAPLKLETAASTLGAGRKATQGSAGTPADQELHDRPVLLGRESSTGQPQGLQMLKPDFLLDAQAARRSKASRADDADEPPQRPVIVKPQQRNVALLPHWLSQPAMAP